jgi:hypothetical protein
MRGRGRSGQLDGRDGDFKILLEFFVLLLLLREFLFFLQILFIVLVYLFARG